MAGSTKEYSYCVTGMEGECILPDELFPLEEMAHEIEEMEHEFEEAISEFVHDVEEVVHEIEHDIEVVVHDINVALHLEPANGTESETNGASFNESKEEEEEDALLSKRR